MSTYPNAPGPGPGYGGYKPAPSNGLGMTGFIISLVGAVVTAGLLCPVGLLFSLIGLRQQPRGFAIAGTIIGLVGSIMGVAFILMLVNAINTGFSMFSMFGPQMTTSSTMWSATTDIENHYYNNANTLPDESTGNAIVNSYVDAWNTPIKYKPTPNSTTDYELVSAGPDQQFGNADDYVESFSTNWSQHGAHQQQQLGAALDDGLSQEQIDYPFEQAAQTLGEAFPVGTPLPDQAPGNAAIANQRDAWGNALEYSPTNNPPYYHLKSAGPDGDWQTDDDLVKSYYFEPTGSP